MASVEGGFSDFNIALSNCKKTIDTSLERLLAEQKQIEPHLLEAMRYTLEGPGSASALQLFCGPAGRSVVRSIRMLKLPQQQLKWCIHIH